MSSSLSPLYSFCLIPPLIFPFIPTFFIYIHASSLPGIYVNNQWVFLCIYITSHSVILINTRAKTHTQNTQYTDRHNISIYIYTGIFITVLPKKKEENNIHIIHYYILHVIIQHVIYCYIGMYFCSCFVLFYLLLFLFNNIFWKAL